MTTLTHLKRTHFLAGAARTALLAGALASPLFVAPAFGQDAPSENSLDERRDVVTVTARRREETLQDTPVALTAASAQRLEEIGALDITSLQRITPNATIETARGTNSTLIAFIRGVGQQDPLWGFEPGVGLYVDDVYISRPQGALLDIFDIERIEVLRGPQGTLYGRNTIGGAIKYVTRRLDTDAPTLTARLNVGTYNQLDQIVSGSIPLSDTFAIGAAIANYQRDGFGENVFSGADHYDKDVLAARISAEWTPTDSLFFRLAADRTEDDSNAKHGFRRIPGADGEPVLDDVFDTAGGAGDENSVETQGVSFTAEWAINDAFTLKSISAYRDGESVTPIDFDALPEPDFDVPARYFDEQFTQELQLIFEHGNLSGVAGLYYLNSNASGEFDAIFQEVAPGFTAALTAYTAGDVDQESYAAYADVSYRFNPQWSVSLGARYTEDTTTADVRNELWFGLGTASFDPSNTTSTLASVRTDLVDLERTDDSFDPRVSISYEPNDDLSFYASYTEGFKSGGFDPRGRSDLDPTGRVQFGFGPETVNSYELGAKGNFFNGALTANSAIFFADYEDQQITLQQGADSDDDGINDTFQSIVLNAGKSEYFGVETEATWFISDSLSADFNLGWIDAEIVEVVAPDFVTGELVDQSDNFVVQNTPEWTAALGLTYSTALPSNLGDLTLNGRVSYRDEYNIFNIENSGFAPGDFAEFPEGGPALDPDANTLLDATAIWDFNDNWRFSLAGRNLTDEEVEIALYNFLTPSRLGTDSAYSSFYAPPRTVTASIQFTY